jgi:hypothetical protein
MEEQPTGMMLKLPEKLRSGESKIHGEKIVTKKGSLA